MSKFSKNYKYCRRSRTYRSTAQLHAISRSYSEKEQKRYQKVVELCSIQPLVDMTIRLRNYKDLSSIIRRAGWWNDAWVNKMCKAVETMIEEYPLVSANWKEKEKYLQFFASNNFELDDVKEPEILKNHVETLASRISNT